MSQRQVVAERCARCYKKAEKICAKCKARWYCSPGCQRKDWELGHKFACSHPQQPPVTAKPPLPPRLVYTAAKASELMATPLSAPRQGLRNVGNTCYINAVLQCMAASTPLIEGLQRGSDKIDDNSSLSGMLLNCAAELNGTQASPGAGPVVPANIVRRLLQLSQSMIFGRQEDSHELNQVLLVALSQEMAGQALPSEAETTLVHQLFRSVIASQLLCPQCGFISVSFESYLDLQLEIHEYTDTLEEMLEAFTCPERLDAKNLYRCENCQQQVRAHKQLSIYQAPNILCIQLKRFRPGFFGKVNKYVEFPKLLNITTYVTPGSDEGVLEYELYAVLLHLDLYNTTAFGHYICATKAADGSWWLYDDDRVSPVSADEVLKSNAYMLFYRRKTPRNMVAGSDSSPAATAGAKSSSAGASSPSSPGGAMTAGSPEAAAVVSPEPVLCAGACGFYGRPEQDNFCSRCFKQRFPEKAAAMATAAKAEASKASAAQASTVSPDANIDASTSLQRLSLTDSTGNGRSSASSSTSTSTAPPRAATAAPTAKVAPAMRKVGRNDPCPCGSGRKYKVCHGKNA